MQKHSLILGGARSGKSSYAESLAQKSGKQVIYLATSPRSLAEQDSEMSARIEHHQSSRPSHWQTVEEPEKLAATLQQYSQVDNCILVDCLTLWLTNHLLKEDELVSWQQAKQDLLACLQDLPGEVILVSNEVGMGIVPLGKINRQFVDQAGWLHQELAELVEQVVFVAAGLPLKMK